jgi:ATP-dependent protease HslVU (ClpYQ) peptidase subunit
MTCIVGLKYKGKVYIGADSLASNDQLQRTVRVDDKVFIKGDMLFGFTVSYRMGQILRYSFDLPERNEGIGDMDYLVGHFIPALIQCYTDQGFIKKDETGESVGGQFLLGYRGGLYDIQDDFQVAVPFLDYAACGCGGELALGSMFTTQKLNKTLSPEKRIVTALEAATEHSAGVAPPFVVLHN